MSENAECHDELQRLASSLGLSHHSVFSPDSPTVLAAELPPATHVVFLLSISNVIKAALLASALLVVYTPSNEHFGIVPLEAMLASRPVLAANTGGPVETVRDPTTGWLRDPRDVPAWTAVMRRALAMPAAEVARMGSAGARRVRSDFGRDRMAARLDSLIADITRLMHRPPIAGNLLFILLVALGLGLATAYGRLFRG